MMLSREDIKHELVQGHLKIYPFESKNLTGIGYNLSTTNFAFSVNDGVLLTLHRRTTSKGLEHFIEIPPLDTVLFFSKEYISIDGTLAGVFHSKVSPVCQGLGHISTTLDPTWRGQLIISINNPTSRSIEFSLDKNSGNAMTLLLYKLDTGVSGPNIHDNNQGRCDLLLSHFAAPITQGKEKQQHLELKDFILNEYADSLNGDDNFMGYNTSIDKYSTRVSSLFFLRERLLADQAYLVDNIFLVDPRPSYSPLKSGDERDLICSCCLYQIGLEKDLSSSFSVISESHKQGALDFVNQLLRVIDYELESINHARRIAWQNGKVEEFACEESELAKARRATVEHMYRKRKMLLAGILIAITVLIIAVVSAKLTGAYQGDISGIVAALLSALLTICLFSFDKWSSIHG